MTNEIIIDDLGFWNIAYFNTMDRNIYINNNYLLNEKILKVILKHECKHLIDFEENTRWKAMIKSIFFDYTKGIKDANELYRLLPRKMVIKRQFIQLFTLGLIHNFFKSNGHWYFNIPLPFIKPVRIW